MSMFYIQKIEAELVARRGGVGRAGAELVTWGRRFFGGSKDFWRLSLRASFVIDFLKLRATITTDDGRSREYLLQVTEKAWLNKYEQKVIVFLYDPSICAACHGNHHSCHGTLTTTQQQVVQVQ
jgi:hypothetical protein